MVRVTIYSTRFRAPSGAAVTYLAFEALGTTNNQTKGVLS
jgi:hypothetical protein